MMDYTYTCHTPHTDPEAVAEWFEQLPERFGVCTDIIHDKRNTLKVMRLPDGERVVVKQHRRPNGVQRMHNTLHHQSKARRAYDNALELLRRGVETPLPVGFAEESVRGVVQRSWYVYRWAEGAPLATLIREAGDEPPYPLIKQLAAYLATLHERGVQDKDLNVGNILCNDMGGDEWRFSLIDINRVAFTPKREPLGLRRSVGSLTVLPTDLVFDFGYFAMSYLRARNIYTLRNLDYMLNAKRVHDRTYRRRKLLLHQFRHCA